MISRSEENGTDGTKRKEKEDLWKSVTGMSGAEKRRGGGGGRRREVGRKQKSKHLVERGDEQMGTGRKGWWLEVSRISRGLAWCPVREEGRPLLDYGGSATFRHVILQQRKGYRVTGHHWPPFALSFTLRVRRFLAGLRSFPPLDHLQLRTRLRISNGLSFRRDIVDNLWTPIHAAYLGTARGCGP